MTTVQDVAAYILAKKGELPAMKLQKLLYYAQAWSLVWDEAPLFPETVEAWANGPVIPDLYKHHKGQFIVSEMAGNPENITPIQKETIDKILEFYGDRTSQWLSDLTHQEEPWISARKGLAATQRGNQEITLAAMAEYYSSL